MEQVKAIAFALSFQAILCTTSIAKAEQCALDTSQQNCTSKCYLFLYATKGKVPLNLIKPYSGKELKNWSEPDFDHFRSDFKACHADIGRATMPTPPTDAELPSFVDDTITYLKNQQNTHEGDLQDPTEAALKACPTAINHLNAAQGLLAEWKGRNISTKTQDGQQIICSYIRRITDDYHQVANDLKNCRDSGIVGLRPVFEKVELLTNESERLWHNACD